MLIYVEGKHLLGHTFVLSCNATDTIGRVKALILHILHGVGLSEQSFRLQFNGYFLREPLTVQDYNIPEMTVLQIVPISFGHYRQSHSTANEEVPQPPTTAPTNFADLQPKPLSQSTKSSSNHETLAAIDKEIATFHLRQRLLKSMRAIIWLQLAFTVVNFATVYWWSGFWTGLVALLALLFVPTYVHVGGAMGKMSKWDTRIMVVYIMCFTAVSLTDIVMFIYLLVAIVINANCNPGSSYHDATAALGCSHRVWLSLTLYPLQAMLLVSSTVVAAALIVNFKFEAGKLIEPTLTKVKEVKQLIHIAQEGRLEDRRQVAFELNNIALLGNENKSLIAAEGGMDLLTSMASDKDEVTQEYAVEALAELLSLPTIQCEFIDQGGVAMLCALLHSFNNYIVQEVAAALSYLTPHCPGNRKAVIQETGLKDLLQAYQRVLAVFSESFDKCTAKYTNANGYAPRCFHSLNTEIQKSIGKILLDLARCSETQGVLCDHTELVDMMVARSGDEGTVVECKVCALKTLEELGKIKPQVVVQRFQLIPVLLDALSSMTFDSEVDSTIMNLLLIYAKDPQGSKYLVSHGNLLTSLTDIAPSFAHSKHLCTLMVDVVHSLMVQSDFRVTLIYLGIRKLLKQIQSCCNHRDELKGTVDQCLELLEL